MFRPAWFKAVLAGSVCSAALLSAASARNFAIPSGDLESALTAYSQQSGIGLIVSDDQVKGIRTRGATGDMSDDAALSLILSGTGFVIHRHSSGKIGIARDEQSLNTIQGDFTMQLAQATPARAAVETVTVTSSKLGGADVQSIPISITALSQEQLTATQTAGGPDLVKQVPNLTFSKTNFTGYNIEIRGIGTQAISVTTDPAVAVAFNDIPFIRNHFFEQEFYDVSQVEVLRGPQGTLYGRNATAGVVNVIPAKPTDQFEALASADIGNYHNRRFEGMVNIPIVDDRLDIRLAGEWTKRDGYTEDTTLNTSVDGRDLWSARMTIGWKPTSDLQTYLVWEHFSEDDDRLRTAKQLCKTDVPPTSVNGAPVLGPGLDQQHIITLDADYLSQGCKDVSLYSPDAFEVPYGFSLPYAIAAGFGAFLNPAIDPYAETTQSTNLRDIQSAILPAYKAKNDTLEFNAAYSFGPALTFTSQTGYNQDFLWSTEDYNRFDTTPGIFSPGANGLVSQTGFFCDPQLGCSNRLVAQDLSDEHAWQLSQELRLTSNFGGPFNFSLGGNYLHYETEENYYVFINGLTAYAINNGNGNGPGPADYRVCLGSISNGRFQGGFQNPNPILGGGPPNHGNCAYVDPNPIGSLDNQGHNYFLSQNPYTLNSYAGFGEVYYNVLSDLKLTGGLRWTDDQKHFTDIPSELTTYGYGYPVTGIVNQQWDEFTGRTVVDWTPKLDFTDQTLVYGSYSRGYKAGGANPPGAIFLGGIQAPIHPLTFKPEFIDAFELGSKNTLLDGALTLNGDVFYYDYKDYQISEIVDRTSINLNFNATVKGAELETTWEPAPGLKFSFAGGYEDTRIANGQSAIDLMDRTGGNPGWMVVKPFPTIASNCILPTYVVQALLEEVATAQASSGGGFAGEDACDVAYNSHYDPATGNSYTADPTGQANHNYAPNAPIPAGYPGFDPCGGNPSCPVFDPVTDKNTGTYVDDPYTGQNTYNGVDYGPVPNNGEGFAKNLGGNQLPNAPHFTASFSAEYTMPVSPDWAASLHTDFYWQSQQWARVFEDSIDRIHGYTNVNLALILTSQNGWQVMGYVKNVFDTTAITGTFLNSDDSGLTTNVFLTDPRLFGVRVTKNW